MQISQWWPRLDAKSQQWLIDNLGDSGGGTVPLDRVVGKVVGRSWTLADAGQLPTTASTGAGS